MAEQGKAGPPNLPTLAESGHWVGLEVDGVGGRTLGRVAVLHVDAADGEPRWVVLRLGPVAGCTAIPFEHVAESAGRLWAPYDRDSVRDAPRFRPKDALSAEDELVLCGHWAMPEQSGRTAEVADKDGEEITAVPMET